MVGKGQWNDLEKKIKPAKIIFLPYTKSISSTIINNFLEKKKE
tara:strand:- start:1241 stop:1369 length:129 start_codon:yes stop_codon:yes gene_type:complete